MLASMRHDIGNMRALGWSYPAGAENDPRAPWNEPDAELAWEDVRDDAVEREVDAITDDGIESGVFGWMQADPERKAVLDDLVADMVHTALIRRGDRRDDAVLALATSLKPWVERYVDAWPTAKRHEFLADREAEARDDD